jgi:sulfur-oxidizing protein SoxY
MRERNQPRPAERATRLPPLVLALALAMTIPAPVLAADGDDPERQARWEEISQSIFGDRPILAGEDVIQVEAPARALDAALVPITLKVARKEGIKAVHLVIDENPSPYAANARFGPAGDPSELRLRVRINGYTNVHAVAETTDGRLYQTSVFVKASGGCSAPIGVSDEEAMKGIGQMKMKFGDDPDAAVLMIRHPNFSGMQMNQVTRTYTPARFLDEIKISYGDRTVLDLAGDISLSTDPVIGFTYHRSGEGRFSVEATDNEGGRWEKSFPVPVETN